jgi:hypothetical protein
MTTIDTDGMRLEYTGGECVTVISEAPTIVKIDELIADLISLRSQTLTVEKSCDHSSRLLHKPLSSQH